MVRTEKRELNGHFHSGKSINRAEKLKIKGNSKSSGDKQQNY